MNSVEIHLRRIADGKDIDSIFVDLNIEDENLLNLLDRSYTDWYIVKKYTDYHTFENETNILSMIQNHWWGKYNEIPFTPVVFESNKFTLTNYLTFVGIPLQQIGGGQAVKIDFDFEKQLDDIFDCLTDLKILPPHDAWFKEEEFLYNFNKKRVFFCDVEDWSINYTFSIDQILGLKQRTLEYFLRRHK